MSEEPEISQGFWHLVFDGLHLSIAQLIGATVGAGVSIPITQNLWGFFS